MRVVILAGGKGKRIAPYTMVLPKPLMPIVDRPILEIIIRQLKHYGFADVTLAVGYLVELLEAFFGNGSKFGVQIDYSIEDKPLGTAGPLANIEGLNETFIVMNGDLLTTMDYSKLVRFHKENNAVATIGMCEREVKIDLGVIEADNNHMLTKYSEKPIIKYNVSMGVYIFEPKVLKYIKKNEYFDFPDLIQILMANKETVLGYPFEGYWLDIGRFDDYEQAVVEFEKRKSDFLPE